MKQYFNILLLFLLCPMAIFAQQSLRTSVYFAPAEYDIKKDQEAVLQTFLEDLPTNKSAYDFLLVGHTDNVGDELYNEKLSKQRCKSVKDYLLTQGISVPQLAYEGKGYRAPVASNETIEGKAKNRRVELVLMPKGSFSEAPIQVPFETIRYQAEAGLEYNYERSGTKIRIPADALVFADGSPVKGEVEVQYREFRDAADFVATDISMLYDHQHQFESAGMFELNASSAGRKVYVKPEEYIDVAFVMTSDSVEDVSFFEYKNEQWETLGALDRVSQQNTFDVNGTCKKLYRYKMPPLKEDTLTTFLNAMRTGYYMAKEEDFEQYYRIGFLTLDERFQDMRYAGTKYLARKVSHVDWDAVEESRQLTPIAFEYNKEYIQVDPVLKEIRLPKGLLMSFQSGKGKNTVFDAFPEMQELVRREWMVLPKGKHKPSARINALKILDNRYMDVRVDYLGEEEFQFVFKKIGGFDTLRARPVFESVERKNKETVAKLLMANYTRNMNKKRERFDERIEFYEENWKYFLAFSKSIMPAREQCQSINGWVKHFAKNSKTMEARYYAYSGLAENTADLRPLMSRAVAGTPIPLDRMPLPASQRLMQSLSINGFGVFNCDAIQRMGPERININAEFITETGEKMDVRIVNIIDYNFNGILRLYNTTKLTLNPTRRHAFVITDFFGDVYMVDSEAIANEDYSSEKSVYSFKARPIISNSVEAIRDAIAIN